MVNHCLLNRVKLTIAVGDALYRADNRLVGHRQQKNTGVYRLIYQRAAPQLVRRQSIQNALHKVLKVVRLLEDCRLLAQAGGARLLPIKW